jgi:hypothetical protein
MTNRYDIFHVEGKDLRWVEAVPDLATASNRIQVHAIRTPGEYMVFDQQTQMIVWKSSGLIKEN